jgi:hypothetical protein
MARAEECLASLLKVRVQIPVLPKQTTTTKNKTKGLNDEIFVLTHGSRGLCLWFLGLIAVNLTGG